MYKDVIIIGASGHGKVIADILVKSGIKIIGFLDDDISINNLLGYKVLGKLDDIEIYKNDASFIIGIGSNQIRKRIAENYNQLIWHTAIHPTAQIGLDVEIGEGTVVMANTIINSSTRIGKHCIINSGAIVEHDNVLSDFVHISPNASLGGNVIIEELTHVGIGATVKNNINITSNCIIGAGAVVVKNILISGTYIGVPVRKID